MIKVYLPNDKSELRFSSNWMSKDNSSMTIIHLIIDVKFFIIFSDIIPQRNLFYR